MVQSVISTVGTSLLSNLARPKAHPHLNRFVACEDWGQLAKQLRDLSASAWLCGAEINSLHQLLERPGFEAVSRLDFCISSTTEGRQMGEILKAYYQKNYRVEIHAIDDLRDDDPERFRVHGLRNLARELGRLVRGAGDSRYVALNCTGGYKAQVAIAVLLGQALKVPVYYKHERFESVICFPSMPVSFDYDLLGRHADLLTELERGGEVEMEPTEIEDGLRALLEEVQVEGKTWWAMAPIGQIYLEAFRRHYPPAVSLPPAAEEGSRKAPTFGDDHHYPKGFKKWAQSLWEKAPYIRTCHTLDYSGQSSIRHGRFRAVEGQTYDIVGEFHSGKQGARLALLTTASSGPQRTAAVMDLNDRFSV